MNSMIYSTSDTFYLRHLIPYDIIIIISVKRCNFTSVFFNAAYHTNSATERK